MGRPSTSFGRGSKIFQDIFILSRVLIYRINLAGDIGPISNTWVFSVASAPLAIIRYPPHL